MTLILLNTAIYMQATKCRKIVRNKAKNVA